MNASGGIGWQGVAREYEDYEMGEVGPGREGERELGWGYGDEVCQAGSIGRNDTEHDRPLQHWRESNVCETDCTCSALPMLR